MVNRLIDVVIAGYARGEPEGAMVHSIYDGIMAHNRDTARTGDKRDYRKEREMTAAMLTAAVFRIAKASKWNLVLGRPDGTRVIIPCDTEEEQRARALEIMKEQTT